MGTATAVLSYHFHGNHKLKINYAELTFKVMELLCFKRKNGGKIMISPEIPKCDQSVGYSNHVSISSPLQGRMSDPEDTHKK